MTSRAMNDKVMKRKREDSVPSNNRGSSSEDEIPAPAITTVICNRCGHEVPEMNWTIHHSTCRKRSAESSKEGSSTNETSQHQEVEERVEPANICATENMERFSPMADGVRQEEQDQGPSETVDLSEHAQWECPRCTLLNPDDASFCGACNYTRMFTRHNRSMTTSGNENGILPQQPQPPQMPGNLRYNITVQEVNQDSIRTVNNLVSGALIGTLAGGGIGGLIGLMGGAIVDGVTRWNNRRADRMQSSQETEPTLRPTAQSDNRSTARTQHPRRGAIRIVQIRASRNGLGVTGPQVDPLGGGIGTLNPTDRMILQMLMLSALTQGTDHVDHMTFEELLQRFGVGNEHRGASQEVIDQIPLHTFHDEGDEKDDLKDKPVCNICLEEFQTDEKIRKLSCSHRFHKQCIDRWLGMVASCPICKHQIESNIQLHTNSADTSNPNNA